MKIVGKVNRTEHYFEKLSIGATFVCPADVGHDSPYIYMALKEVTDSDTGEVYNAVEIGSGEFAYFEDGDLIKKIKVEAHIVS